VKRLALVVLVVLASISPLHHLQPIIENGTAWGAAVGLAWAAATVWVATQAATTGG
jgi:hypothetical protein